MRKALESLLVKKGHAEQTPGRPLNVLADIKLITDIADFYEKLLKKPKDKKSKIYSFDKEETLKPIPPKDRVFKEGGERPKPTKKKK
jgi:abortive infection bacteriophage resistance protein